MYLVKPKHWKVVTDNQVSYNRKQLQAFDRIVDNLYHTERYFYRQVDANDYRGQFIYMLKVDPYYLKRRYCITDGHRLLVLKSRVPDMKIVKGGKVQVDVELSRYDNGFTVDLPDMNTVKAYCKHKGISRRSNYDERRMFVDWNRKPILVNPFYLMDMYSIFGENTKPTYADEDHAPKLLFESNIGSGILCLCKVDNVKLSRKKFDVDEVTDEKF